ncbi:hypothetical protein CH363_05030 [Leptospira haakeii]|uniref:Uncharacterized protein n=1 Tax=Leptospira haakeii TaxID=2023198 RepID=A0ABX4PQW5_9LEPT|nr:hypothetical protein CH363_05030 [Leptospira haakeii]PKA21713.1 hypothetical protein CH377_05030 [Leptospira haakeii]
MKLEHDQVGGHISQIVMHSSGPVTQNMIGWSEKNFQISPSSPGKTLVNLENSDFSTCDLFHSAHP